MSAAPEPMEGIAPTTEDAALATNPAAAPVVPEVEVSETLYIQNLNERIKIPGAGCFIC
jgi:hypothetical protein